MRLNGIPGWLSTRPAPRLRGRWATVTSRQPCPAVDAASAPPVEVTAVVGRSLRGRGMHPRRRRGIVGGQPSEEMSRERAMPTKDPKWRIPGRFQWPRHLVKLLGKLADHEVARRAGVARKTVTWERYQRGIPPAFPHRPRIERTDEMISLLGTMVDREVAAELDIPRESVSYKRRMLGIPAHCEQPPRPPEFWTPQRDALLGTAPDTEIAKKLRISLRRVAYRRRKLGISPFKPAPKPLKWTAPASGLATGRRAVVAVDE